jgi:hypothetical protein
MTTFGRSEFIYDQIEFIMKLILEGTLSQKDREIVEVKCTKYKRRDILLRRVSNVMDRAKSYLQNK